MPASVDIREGMAEAFNVLAEEFHDDAVVALAKPSSVYGEFDTITTITTNRFFEFADDRKTVLLEIATDTDALTEAIAEATHVVIDDTPFEIQRQDTQAPQSTDVTWKITASRFPQASKFTTLRA